MFIPGIIISIATFPGVIIHELSHELFCRWNKVKVFKVCYFQADNPPGYVIHEHPTTYRQSFLITIAPFILGTVITIIIFFVSNSVKQIKLLEYPLIWLGISVAMNSFPSSGDAKNLWHETNKNIKSNFIIVLVYPIVFFIWLSNILSIVWFDLWYAIILYSLINPNLID